MTTWNVRKFMVIMLLSFFAFSLAAGAMGCAKKDDDDGGQCSSCATNADCERGLTCIQTTNFGRVCGPSSGAFSCPIRP